MTGTWNFLTTEVFQSHRLNQLPVMPWRVNTLTEYKATEGLHSDVAAHSIASDGHGDGTKDPVVGAETLDLFSGDVEPVVDIGFDEGTCVK